jgi:hypothetical protein
MIGVVETIKANIAGDFSAPVLMHMLSSAGVGEMFFVNTATQAQLLGAMGKLPETYRAMESARNVENALWRGFADMIVRAVGGMEPTLDDILLEMGENGAADGIGQLVSYGAGADRAKAEIALQSQRHVLRNAANMPIHGGDWASQFLENMRDVWNEFDGRRNEGFYEPYDLAEEITELMKQKNKITTKIYQFPIQAAH